MGPLPRGWWCFAGRVVVPCRVGAALPRELLLDDPVWGLWGHPRRQSATHAATLVNPRRNAGPGTRGTALFRFQAAAAHRAVDGRGRGRGHGRFVEGLAGIDDRVAQAHAGGADPLAADVEQARIADVRPARLGAVVGDVEHHLVLVGRALHLVDDVDRAAVGAALVGHQLDGDADRGEGQDRQHHDDEPGDAEDLAARARRSAPAGWEEYWSRRKATAPGDNAPLSAADW